MSPEERTEVRPRPTAPGAPAATAPPPPAAPAPTPPAEKPVEVRRAEFQPLQPQAAVASRDNIGRLMDVVVAMTVEIGSTQIPLREVMGLGPGSVVKLERVLGEPVDILINRELVARGEVVVIDERFGVRVTQLVQPDREKA